MTFHLDYESSSFCDIRKYGAYRYACDPSTRILMFAIAEGSGEPVLWRFDEPQSPESREAYALLEQAIAGKHTLYAHNSQFEHAMSRYRLMQDVGLPAPEIDSWICTQAMCRRAAIPPSLGEAAKYLKLHDGKDKKGKMLIRLFSDRNAEHTLYHATDKKLRMKTFSPIHEPEIPWEWLVTIAGEKITVRQAWGDFRAYCKQDVRVEQAIHARLAHFELTGNELAGFRFNQKMNDRGVPVNISALEHAQELVAEVQSQAAKAFRNLTGLSPSQNAKFLEWLKEEGFKGKSLSAKTLDADLLKSTLTPRAREALDLRNDVSYAAVKKIPAMLGTACPDGYVRGVNVWHGTRTGRDSSSLIQAQNFKKATIGDSAVAYALICAGEPLETFQALWKESTLEVIASCIRHFVQPKSGKLLDLDFASVESRITAMWSGDTKELDIILSGKDPYKMTAVDLFGVRYDEVTKEQRNIAKVVNLQACFGASGKGLRHSLDLFFGIKRTLKECNKLIKDWRVKHHPVVDTWKAIGTAMEDAIFLGVDTDILNGNLGFKCRRIAGIKYLIMRLPSGREIYYPDPQVDPITLAQDKDDEWHPVNGHVGIEEATVILSRKFKRPFVILKVFETHAVSFHGKKTGSALWGRVFTNKSKVWENAVQAIGADLLSYGCRQAEAAGYEIMLIVHDQSLAYDNLPMEPFIEAMCSKEPWAEAFPLDASCEIADYYLKG